MMILNIAVDSNLSIGEMAKIVLKATDNQHLKIMYDTTKANGQHRKDIGIDRLKSLIPDYKFITLEEGIKSLYYGK